MNFSELEEKCIKGEFVSEDLFGPESRKVVRNYLDNPKYCYDFCVENVQLKSIKRIDDNVSEVCNANETADGVYQVEYEADFGYACSNDEPNEFADRDDWRDNFDEEWGTLYFSIEVCVSNQDCKVTLTEFDGSQL